MADMDQFKDQQYLNIETFRKNGEGVKTPVWFVQIDNQLCIVTELHSGKVKRMRNNPAVRVTPCKMDGTVTGEWCPATIRFMQGDEVKEMDKAYNKKYGVMKFLFELPKLFSKKPERAVIAVTLNQ